MAIKSIGDAVAAIGQLRSWQIIVLISTIILAFYLPVFQARFGVADDHEIIHYLSNGRISVFDIWAILTTETEAGSPFQTSRYRPIYYLLRLTETWMWADWATPWYIARLAILAYFSFEAFRLVQRLMGPGYAITFFLAILFSRVFVDSLLRLGAAESYAALGCALCMTGARRISQSGLLPANAVLVAIGTLISVGSKENFVFLLLPLAMILVNGLEGRNAASIATRTMTTIVLALGLVIWSAVLPGTFGKGATLYQEALPKLAFLQSHPIITSLAIALIAGIALIMASRIVLRMTWLERWVPVNREALLWAGLFVAAIVLQLLVYREFVTRNRYGFPAIHMLIFLGLLIVSFVHGKLKEREWPQSIRDWGAIAVSVVVVLIVIMPETKAWKRVNRMVQETVVFQERYAKLAAAIRNNPESNVVFIVHRYDSYEPIVSVQRNLFRDFGKFPVAVAVEGDIKRDKLATQLTARMRDWQENGGRGFVPLKDIDLPNCIGVGFRGSESHLACPVVTQIWPLR